MKKKTKIGAKERRGTTERFRERFRQIGKLHQAWYNGVTSVTRTWFNLCGTFKGGRNLSLTKRANLDTHYLKKLREFKGSLEYRFVFSLSLYFSRVGNRAWYDSFYYRDDSVENLKPISVRVCSSFKGVLESLLLPLLCAKHEKHFLLLFILSLLVYFKR